MGEPMLLEPGHHIRIRKSNGFKKYYHHGIYCGEDMVIHLWDRQGNKKHARVQRTSLQAFVEGCTQEEVTPEIILYENGVCYEPEEVVRRAESKLGETKYNLASNNCEHFATWCKTGRHKSSQVRKIVYAIAGVAGSIALAVLVKVVKGIVEAAERRDF